MGGGGGVIDLSCISANDSFTFYWAIFYENVVFLYSKVLSRVEHLTRCWMYQTLVCPFSCILCQFHLSWVDFIRGVSVCSLYGVSVPWYDCHKHKKSYGPVGRDSSGALVWIRSCLSNFWFSHCWRTIIAWRMLV